jgi:hypothetical protein
MAPVLMTGLQPYFNKLCLQKAECMSASLDLVKTLYHKWTIGQCIGHEKIKCSLQNSV